VATDARLSPVHIRWLADSVRLTGADPVAAFAAYGVPAGTQDPEHEWLPVDVLDRAMRAAVACTGDASFGLRVLDLAAVAWFVGVAAVVASAPTLSAALVDLARFSPLLETHPEIEFETSGRVARVSCRPLATSAVGRRFRAELVLGAVARMLRAVGATPGHWMARFAFPAPLDRDAYSAIFGDRVEFDASDFSVDFDASLLTAAWPGHDPGMYAAARVAAERELARRRDDIADRTRRLVLSNLPNLPGIAEAAGLFGTTERSLRRSLAARNTSYAETIDACRRTRAEQQLVAEPELPIKQVARNAGFDSVSAFHRAFRRWNDITPARWRAAGISGPPAGAPIAEKLLD